MQSGPKMLPDVEAVALAERRVFVRHAAGCSVFEVDAVAALAVLERLDGSPLERSLQGLPRPLQSLGRRLVAELEGVALTSEPPTPGSDAVASGSVVVVGNGPWSERIHERLAPMFNSHLHRVQAEEGKLDEPGRAPRASVASLAIEPGLAAQLFAQHDVVVCALELVPWASFGPLNRAALESPRGVGVFVAIDPDTTSIGPVVWDPALPCFLCARLELLGAGAEAEPVLEEACERLAVRGSGRVSPAEREMTLGALVREVVSLLSRRLPTVPAASHVIDGQGHVHTREVAKLAWCPDCKARARSRRHHPAFTWGADLGEAAALDAVAVPWGQGQRQRELRGLLQGLGAAGVSSRIHAVSTFHEHLVGTWTILAGWGLPDVLCRAGLFHSVYGSDAFDWPAFSGGERARVRELIGPDAERLVYLFCTIDRPLLQRSVEGLSSLPAGGVLVRNWRTGQQGRLGADDVGRLLAIEAANIAEQAHAGDLSPTLWVAGCQAWAPLIAERGLEIPPLRGALLTHEREGLALRRYQQALELASTDRSGAEAAALEASELNPLVGEPLLVAASLAPAQSDASRERAQRGVARLLGWFTAWDKRAPWEVWLALGRRLAGGH